MYSVNQGQRGLTQRTFSTAQIQPHGGSKNNKSKEEAECLLTIRNPNNGYRALMKLFESTRMQLQGQQSKK